MSETCLAPANADTVPLLIQQEAAEIVAREIVPLMQDHAETVKNDLVSDFPLSVNLDFYFHAERGNVLRLFTLRAASELVGYAIFLVHPSIHRKMVVAHEDAFYIKPEYRRGRNALRLMKFAEDHLRGCADCVIYHAPTSNPTFGQLLKARGYEKHAEYFARRFDHGLR